MKSWKTPQLGFGTLRLPGKNGHPDIPKIQEMVDVYQKDSLCYYDIHPHYASGRAEEIIRQTVVEKYPREDFLLADKMPFDCKSKTDYERYFTTSLKNCGVNYFDYYLLHCLTKEIYKNHERLDAFNYLLKKKEQGYIRHIGFSFHDKPELLDQILTEHPETEFVYLQLNYYDWKNPIINAEENYEVARKHQVPIFVMEPIKGGSLAKNTEIFQKPELQDVSLSSLALNFVAKLPGIHIIMSGMFEAKHIIENRKIIAEPNDTLSPSIYTTLCAEIRKQDKIECTTCHYCENECPKNIPIPELFSLLNSCDKEILGIPLKDFPGGRYNVFLTEYQDYTKSKGKASDCVSCGRCELKCPQKISIRKYIKTAKTMFETGRGLTDRQKTMKGLLSIVQNECPLNEWFAINHYHKIAIYGMGDIGQLLWNALKEYPDIQIQYGIDKNAHGVQLDGLHVITPDISFESVDAIIVTATFAFEQIYDELSSVTDIPIVSLDDMVEYYKK